MKQAIQSEELTPAQNKAWGQAMSAVGWAAPGFKYTFYKLLVHNDGDHKAIITRTGCPVAATDGKNVMLNPDTFFDDAKYSLRNRLFILAHEIGHNMLNDIVLTRKFSGAGIVPMNDGTTRPFINQLWQMAMDYRLNAILVDSKIGECPKDACYDPTRFTSDMSALDVYKALYDKAVEDGKGKRPGKKGEKGEGDIVIVMPDPQGFDEVLPPGTSTGESEEAAMPNEAEIALVVQQAKEMEAKHSQGRMKGALKKMFDGILKPVVPWQNIIKADIVRKSGSAGYNWKKADKRFIIRDMFSPSRSGHGAGWLVVWCDMSGSVVAEAHRYLNELAGILEDVNPRRLTVLWADDGISRVDELEDSNDLRNIKAVHNVGGGTSPDPCFKWIDDQLDTPDMFIGFTDGYFMFPKKPNYPVIWASTTKAPYKWGTVVHIKPEHRTAGQDE